MVLASCGAIASAALHCYHSPFDYEQEQIVTSVRKKTGYYYTLSFIPQTASLLNLLSLTTLRLEHTLKEEGT